VVSETLRSHLLVGAVGHRRLRDLEYAFTHDAWYVALDLDELDEVNARLRLLGYERRRALRVLARDHLGDRVPPRWGGEPRAELREAVRAHLAVQGLPHEGWRITLIAYPRVLGYVFNPVSFFLCHEVGHEVGNDAKGDSVGALRHVIAEVHNTHGERELYDFAPDDSSDARVFRSSAEKRFYVSPYIGARARYELSVVERGDELAIALHESETDDGDSAVLDAGVRLTRVPLTDGNLARVLAQEPLMSVKTIALIAWHVVRMRLQGMRWERFRPREVYGRWRPRL